MIVPDLREFLTSGSDKKPVLVVLAGPNVAGEPHQLFPPLPPWTNFILPKPPIRKK